jgi:hypothetical protein
LLVVAGGLYFGKLRPDAHDREARLEQLVAAEGERAVEAERLARESARQTSELEERIERLRTKLSQLKAKRDAAKGSKEPDVPRVPLVDPPVEEPEQSEPCQDEHDPMCGTLSLP